MPTGWRLCVLRGDRVEYFVAQAPDKQAAIAAVRRKRGMKNATIFVSNAAPHDDLTWFGLKDGQAREVSR
jgi:hypothetical protein